MGLLAFVHLLEEFRKSAKERASVLNVGSLSGEMHERSLLNDDLNLHRWRL